MERLAKQVTEFIIGHGADSTQREVYEYALICLMNEIFIDIILLFGAWILGLVWEMVYWIVVFNSLRMNIGGLHADTAEKCCVFSVAFGIFSVIVGQYVWFGVPVIACMSAICFYMIYRLAPLENPNHPVNEKRRESARKKGLCFTVFWCGVSFATCNVWRHGSVTGMLAMLGACGLLLAGNLKSNKKN